MQSLSAVLRYLTVPGVLALGAAMCLQFCSGQAQENDAQFNRPVKTVAVKKINFGRTIHTSGLVSAKSQTKLSFKIGGYVDQILVEEGQSVRKGQKLASLNPQEINAQVTQARSAAEKSIRDLQRINKLYADSVVTLENLQDARTAREFANAALEIAEFNRRHSQILAPANGRILQRFIENGELINPGSPVFLFSAKDQDWVVRCGVSEQELVQLSHGDTAKISFDAWPKQLFSATVSEIAETLDPRSATFEIELKIASAPARIISGFLAKAEIFPSKKKMLQTVPIEALVQADQGIGIIFLHDQANNLAVRSEIDIVEIFDRQIAFISHLPENSRVITEGAPYLRDQDAIVVVP